MPSIATSLLPVVASVVAVLGAAFAGTALTTSVAHGAEPPAGPFVWFGTYTGGPANSEGIYVSRFDPATGGLSAPVLAGAASNP